MIMTTMDPTSF